MLSEKGYKGKYSKKDFQRTIFGNYSIFLAGNQLYEL